MVAAGELLRRLTLAWPLGARWRGRVDESGDSYRGSPLYLLGPAVRVSGVIATRVHRIEAEDTAAATIEFESGAIATIAATTAAGDGQPRRVESSAVAARWSSSGTI